MSNSWVPAFLLLQGCAAAAVLPATQRGTVLVLPLDVWGEPLPEEAGGLSAVLREACAEAGYGVAKLDPAAPPLRGDEPDALVRTAAAPSGASLALGAWAGEVEDGRLILAVRLVDAAAGVTVDGAGGIVAPGEAAGALRRAVLELLASPPTPSPRGERTAVDLSAYLAARAGLFDACLAERAWQRPGLAGHASLAITVDVRGDVTDAVVETDLEDAAAVACLRDAALHLRFPEGVGGETTLRRGLSWPR